MAKAELDSGDFRRILTKVDGIGKLIREAAQAKALNRHAGKVRSRAVELVSGELPTLDKGTIRRRIRIRGAHAGDSTAVVEVKQRAINLERFGGSEVLRRRGGVTTRRGVTVSVKQGPKVIASAFVIRGRAGRESGAGRHIVVARASRGSKRFKGRPQVGREPLVGLYGPDAIDVVKNHVERLVGEAAGEINAEIDRLVTKFLGPA